ncbi:Uncharacterised protein [Escherichia coli]|uniref:Uncharacterized protein n=1 Tax=Escherichia coli TaxID=562 RepID=A0A2X3K5S2_ECOLX|nr:Uncharacterised protein [Escherichia coli]
MGKALSASARVLELPVLETVSGDMEPVQQRHSAPASYILF